MKDSDYKNLSIQEFSKAADVYETDQAGVYKLCQKDYPDVLAELEKDAAAFRTVLRKAGLKKGDKVALFLPNSYNFVKALIAVTTSGMTAAVLPAQLDDKSVFGCCMKFGVRALVYDPSLKEKTEFAGSHLPQVVCHLACQA